MGAIKESVIEQEWQEYKLKMDNDLITVKVLINKVLFKPALINTGYKCYSIVNKCQMCHVGQGSEYHVTEHVIKHV